MSNHEILDHADTPIGTFYLARRRSAVGDEWVSEISIDGALLMSSIDPVSERELFTSALRRHRGDGPLDVLVGGLGLGYTAWAALSEPRVRRVRVVEKMGFVIDWMHRGLLPLSAALTESTRVELVEGDIYEMLRGPATSPYDLIVVDVDHAPDDRLSPTSAPFYTEAGQRRVAEHLAPGGVLAVWSASDSPAFAAVLKAAYPSSSQELIEWQDHENPGHPYQNTLFFGVSP